MVFYENQCDRSINPITTLRIVGKQILATLELFKVSGSLGRFPRFLDASEYDYKPTLLQITKKKKLKNF